MLFPNVPTFVFLAFITLSLYNNTPNKIVIFFRVILII